MPVFQGRPYYLELFVDAPADKINSASIFYSTKHIAQYREEALEMYRGRYRYKYDPAIHLGEKFTYFFVVTENDYGIHATPLDSSGHISPKVLEPVDPLEYFRGK
ncbi:MAG: hypothetical protein QF923_03120 [Candidatus Marinimicrobia bacterium]|nr:hypothetical protein [Candidatus Neomarinimicrobiota bacterium]